MKEWIVDIRDNTFYIIKAETQEEAIEQALEFWSQRDPDIHAEELEE